MCNFLLLLQEINLQQNVQVSQMNVCALAVKICSRVKLEMDASPNAKYVHLCALHAKRTADCCHHWILLWLAAGHKEQIEASGVRALNFSIRLMMQSRLE